MNTSFSKHALERIKARGITKDTISKVVKKPDSVITEEDCKHIYQKVLKEDNKSYLFRVFINICKDPNLVIRAYKTSKLDKYEY